MHGREPEMNDTMESVRSEINEIDDELVKLFMRKIGRAHV